DSSTLTLSPGRIRMKCIRILPDTWARTLWPLSSSTRNMAFGSGSTTVPSTSMASSLVMANPEGLGPSVEPPEDVPALFGNGDRVLEVGGEAAVGGDRRPVVLQHPHLPRPHRDHRLDREHHAFLQHRPSPGLAEVRHLRLLVELLADAVSDEGPHHPEP